MIRMLLLSVPLCLAFASPSLAQNVRSSVDRHFRPELGFFENQRTSRNVQHSRQYARDMHYYMQRPTYVVPQVAKQEATILGQSIGNAQREMIVVQSQVAKDPRLVQAATTAVEHLKKAETIQKKLFEECCKDKPDCKLCCTHCSDILKELDKAQAEHDSILRDQEADGAAHDHSHSHDEPAKVEKK